MKLKRIGGALLGLSVVISLGLVPVSSASAQTPVTGAGFTTVNEAVDGPDHCKNGQPNINCNIYDGKDYVWLNGGPSVAYVGDGEYFFSVHVPGGQGNNSDANPNDGTSKNLSDDYDAYTNRTFSVADGVVSYNGSHDFTSNKIRLMPYADTTNPGGVYIMAICSLADGYPVNPSDCKYDAFKIQQGDVAPNGLPLTVSKDANGEYTNTYTWDITKDVDETRIEQSATSATFNYTVKATPDAGTISDVGVTGTITVFNPNVDENGNTVPVSGVNVSDTLSTGTVCTVENASNVTLLTAETQFAYSCDLLSLPQETVSNTVTVTWGEQLLDNGALLTAGNNAWTFEDIVFQENTIDACIQVDDTLVGPQGSECVFGIQDGSATFIYSYVVNGTPGECTVVDNTATYTTNNTGSTGSASKQVTLCVGADLTVGKTFVPSFSRTYEWGIGKVVDKKLVKQAGGTATFNYTVTASQTGFADSGWGGKGVISVNNPNKWQAIQANVSDNVDNGGSCTLDDPSQATVTLPAEGSVDIAYSCTFEAATSGTNTATATWDSAAYNTPNSSTTGTATIAFTTPTNTTNKTVTVTDSWNGGPAEELGTVTAKDEEPYASRQFSYSKTVPVQPGCVSYTNEAKIVETGAKDGETVTVCGPLNTGARTIGFWQNKNGQGIITGGSSTVGVCNSGTWLRQYAQFQDLSATANCRAVGTYVSNVIKSANASGASMNAMLKAQSLATALDVYFSDTALGGNKLEAPAPIGGVTIDLTQVCSDIATCTNYVNVSSAFGGASSLTVQQALTYAATQSNAGGTMWYGNIKATQELAKDTFDAINNRVVFTP